MGLINNTLEPNQFRVYDVKIIKEHCLLQPSFMTVIFRLLDKPTSFGNGIFMTTGYTLLKHKRNEEILQNFKMDTLEEITGLDMHTNDHRLP